MKLHLIKIFLILAAPVICSYSSFANPQPPIEMQTFEERDFHSALEAFAKEAQSHQIKSPILTESELWEISTPLQEEAFSKILPLMENNPQFIAELVQYATNPYCLLYISYLTHLVVDKISNITDHQAPMYEISGKGLEKPSYLIGSTKTASMPQHPNRTNFLRNIHEQNALFFIEWSNTDPRSSQPITSKIQQNVQSIEDRSKELNTLQFKKYGYRSFDGFGVRTSVQNYLLPHPNFRSLENLDETLPDTTVLNSNLFGYTTKYSAAICYDLNYFLAIWGLMRGCISHLSEWNEYEGQSSPLSLWFTFRNQRIFNTIQNQLSSNPTIQNVFIAEARHLVGFSGLLVLLKKAGYTIRQLDQDHNPIG